MTHIVGIGGELRHGKDAIADYLVDEYDYIKIGMSDALAEILYILNPLIPVKYTARVHKPKPAWWFWDRRKVIVTKETRDFTDHERYQSLVNRVGYTKAKENDEVRRLLQVMGTEVGREMIDKDLWVKLMVKKAEEAKATGAPGIAVTGIRFPNEVDGIRESLNGQLWFVKRPLPKTEGSGHASENSVDSTQFDLVIENDSSLNALYSKVDDLLD